MAGSKKIKASRRHINPASAPCMIP
jgi:hypothetical protein